DEYVVAMLGKVLENCQPPRLISAAIADKNRFVDASHAACPLAQSARVRPILAWSCPFARGSAGPSPSGSPLWTEGPAASGQRVIRGTLTAHSAARNAFKWAQVGPLPYP